jgi:polysaccharide export outer membrane protein
MIRAGHWIKKNAPAPALPGFGALPFMSRFRTRFLSSLFLGLLIFAAAKGTALAQTEPAAADDARTGAKPVALPIAPKDYRIGAGDVLLIQIAGEPDLRRKVKVMEQGTIRLPYIERDLMVAGLTEPEATEILTREFTSILKEPQVSLFIEEYHARMASIAGAVRLPKQVPLVREVRLFDMISLAGGLVEKAGNIVQLIHSGADASYETIDLREMVRNPELNRVIRDGDFINIPEAGVFFVSGNVLKPGSYPIKESVRLSQAIAIAGGVAQDSKKREVHLVRSTNGDNTKIEDRIVDLIELEKDPTKDIVLQPYDVVFVPESTRAKQARTLMQTFAGGIASTLGWGMIR